MRTLQFITGREWISLPSSQRDEYIDDAVQYWRERGFPHYSFESPEIYAEFERLCGLASRQMFLPCNELQMSYAGIALANYFHPQMWSVRFARHRTPLECFESDLLLRDCLKHALTLWPDRKGASPTILRDMLRTFRHTRRVSNFRPTIAKAIYEQYSVPGARVLDFSAGYGGRLLGCIASARNYVGYDPCSQQIKGLQAMTETLNRLGLTGCTVQLRQVCAEDGIREEQDESFSLVFTSPPYFDLEKYSDEPTQSYIRYPTYELWRDRFLHTLIAESYRVLMPGGFLILNLNNIHGAPIATDTLEFATRKFHLETTYRLRLSLLPYNRKHTSQTYRSEPVFVFSKRGRT